jgi:L-alanine-DL-glutamate epimerase-like enolase superfamily enzyme
MTQDPGLIVRDVTVRAVVVALRRPLATRVGDFPRWPLLAIDVTTEQDITGRGYIGPYLERAAAALAPAVRDLGEALRGRRRSAGTARRRRVARDIGTPVMYPELSGHLTELSAG